MSLKLSNNAVSRLAANLSNVATSLSVVPGDGALFPTLSVGDWCQATIGISIQNQGGGSHPNVQPTRVLGFIVKT